MRSVLRPAALRLEAVATWPAPRPSTETEIKWTKAGRGTDLSDIDLHRMVYYNEVRSSFSRDFDIYPWQSPMEKDITYS